MNEKSQIYWDSVKASCFTAGSDEDSFKLVILELWSAKTWC
jgi:hypothetical protein